MPRVHAFAAAIAAVATLAVIIGLQAAVEACQQETIARGTKFLHATNVERFDPAYRKEGVTHGQSADADHPSSPAWMSPASNPALSLHVAMWKALLEWKPGSLPPPTVVLYSYETVQPLVIDSCPDLQTVAAQTYQDLVHSGKTAAAGSLANDDVQMNVAFNFCEERAVLTATDPKMRLGYSIAEDSIRHEREFVMCKAHEPAFFKRLARKQCVIRAKRRKGKPKAVLWIWCSAFVNKGRWYKWDLNVDPNAPEIVAARRGKKLLEAHAAAQLAVADLRMKQFRSAGITERAFFHKDFAVEEPAPAAAPADTAGNMPANFKPAPKKAGPLPPIQVSSTNFREVLGRALASDAKKKGKSSKASAKTGKGPVQPESDKAGAVGDLSAAEPKDQSIAELKPPTADELALLADAAKDFHEMAKLVQPKIDLGSLRASSSAPPKK